jgi:hypothetical protein
VSSRELSRHGEHLELRLCALAPRAGLHRPGSAEWRRRERAGLLDVGLGIESAAASIQTSSTTRPSVRITGGKAASSPSRLLEIARGLDALEVAGLDDAAVAEGHAVSGAPALVGIGRREGVDPPRRKARRGERRSDPALRVRASPDDMRTW